MPEVKFDKHDSYIDIRKKFTGAWANLRVELHHKSVELRYEGWDEFAKETTFEDNDSLPETAFTLTDKTTARQAQSLFEEHFGGAAFILRDASVEADEPLAYSNDPFRLPLYRFKYGEFKRRFSERWTNLSIRLCDVAPLEGGLGRGTKELADDFVMKNLPRVYLTDLHDYVCLSDWGAKLKKIRVAAEIKNERFGIVVEGDWANEILLDFQELEKV